MCIVRPCGKMPRASIEAGATGPGRKKPESAGGGVTVPALMRFSDGYKSLQMWQPASALGQRATAQPYLTQLEQVYPRAVSGVLATSMFGTGVDVSRLSLMIVHGQPKTTSSYIQATGRVGRSLPGLIITSLSPTRPRELNHYEYFTGYHLQLYRGVEPVTVYPFAPRARDKGLGPLCVAHLRQQMDTHSGWRDKKKSA